MKSPVFLARGCEMRPESLHLSQVPEIIPLPILASLRGTSPGVSSSLLLRMAIHDIDHD
jgi:hypothetical protein